MQIKNILSLTVIAIFVTVALLSQNIYALTSISSVTWNDVQVLPGGQVVPSEDRPLEFFFQSRDDENNNLPANFQCVVYSIDEDADLDNDNIQTGIDIDGDGTLDVSFSDLTEVATDNCGTNTASSDISYTALSTADYIFVVTGTPLGGNEQISSAAFPFRVPPFQAGPTAGGGGTLADITDFWRKCDQQKPVGTGFFELQSIEYIIKGESKVKDLHFKDHKLKLKIITNTNNDELKAKLTSDGSDEDFRIHFVDTVCNYEGPPYAGGPETAEPKIGLIAETFDAWNPPVPKCDAANTDFYIRELEYPFKVTKNIGDLKDADTKNIEIEMKVDRTPSDDTVAVKGEVFLGKDSNDKDIKLEIEPEKGPQMECKGKSLIT